MFQNNRYFLLAFVLGCAACADRNEEEETRVVPVGPGTLPSAITPPDTPISPPPFDTAAADSIGV